MHKTEGLKRFMEDTRQNVDRYFQQIFDACPETEVLDVARYICCGSGHRWRSMGVLAAGSIFDHNADKGLLPTACAVEMVHAASILLDDMPSMDNARLRRGRPCAHLVFSPWAVDMTAPILVNLAYEAVMRQDAYPGECRVATALEMSKTAKQLCEGQERDITQNEGVRNWHGLQECYRLKTGSLYSTALSVSALLYAAPEPEVAALRRCGKHLGLSVQCFDDVADAIGNKHDTGKDTRQDAAKQTTVDFFGIEGAIAKGEEQLALALAELDIFNGRAQLIKQLTEEVARGLYAEISEKAQIAEKHDAALLHQDSSNTIRS